MHFFEEIQKQLDELELEENCEGLLEATLMLFLMLIWMGPEASPK